MCHIYPFSPPNSATVAAPPLLFHHHAAKEDRDDGAPKARKPRAPKERPPGMTNAAWAADVERRHNETRDRAEREKKLAVKRAAAADKHARLVSMAMGQPRIGQSPRHPPASIDCFVLPFDDVHSSSRGCIAARGAGRAGRDRR
jgi:hypothetical protein